MNPPPNTRMQRTRSSPSALRSPLTRCPLGRRSWVHGPIALFLLALSAATGCMHTWVGGTLYYPIDAELDNSKYRLVYEIHGTSNHAYVDRTEKTVYLAIRGVWRGTPPAEPSPTLLQRQYTVVAGDLDVGATWQTEGDVQVFFYEPVFTRPEPAGGRREVLRLHFVRKADGPDFVEAPLPAAESESVLKRKK
jgi:hypothetical protein